MKGFIEVVDERNKRHLINIMHIEEIVECDENKCFIYLDVVNSGETQDYYVIHEPYDAIKMLIERKAVEEARLSYCKDCNSYNGVRCSACAFDDAMSYIEDAPTADVVEVKHGMWLHKNGEMICSVCGGEALMDEVYYESPFCPDCGAKMDGGVKDGKIC